MARYGFEQRYGLLFEQPFVRFRCLDKERNPLGLSDMTLPLNEFASLDTFFINQNLSINIVFITENKINGLSFPNYPNSIVIFGLGYGIQVLQNISWLLRKKIYYWGDIDTHGFHILHQTRSIFPQCQSLLMDEQTLLAHQDRWVQEQDSQRCLLALDKLTDKEHAVYRKLKSNELGSNVRLEQEMVDYNYLQGVLSALLA